MTDMPRRFYRVTKKGFAFPCVYAVGDYVPLYPEQAQYFMAPYEGMLEPADGDVVGSVSANLALFRRTYLGASSSDPPATLDGETVVEGARYWNTTTQRLRVLTADGWSDEAERSESARDAAIAAAASVTASAGQAEAARAEAQVIRDSTGVLGDAAKAAADAAEDSASAADGSADAAAGSATAAAASATASAGSAAVAATQAGIATTKAAEAAASAAAAGAGQLQADWTQANDTQKDYIKHKPTTLAGYGITDAIPMSQKGAANGVATLGADGKIAESYLPAVVISDVFQVASQAAMLALDAQRGDIAVRSDLNKTFVLSATPATTLANWIEIRSPTDAVLSVAGKTGAVTLAKADVGLANVDNTADADKPVSTATQSALDGKKSNSVSATNMVLGRSSAGAGAIEEIPCTAAGRALIGDADAAAQRATLGLGTAATENTGVGNGLNADLLDGLHASSFGRANNQTAADATTFPIGTLLLVDIVSQKTKNAAYTVYDDGSSTGRYNTVSGTPLSGAWRYCGGLNGDGLMQRVV